MKTTLVAGLAFLALPSLDAFAQQTITYTNGENRATPIVLTVATNPTSLEITSGTATQSGNISQSGGSFSIQKTGAGTLTLSGTNVYSGGTVVRGGLLQVTGSITDGSNSLHVAEQAGEMAALTISGGGKVSSALGVIGHVAGSVGFALITGSDSEWSTTNNGTPFLIGRNGSGTLTLAAGGRLSVVGGAGELRLGALATSSGTLNIGAPIGSAAAAPGIVNASEIFGGGGSGAKTVVFNHTSNDYFLTKTGASGGADVPLKGALAVTHASGTTTLRAANTYTGGTTITGGRLFTTNASGFGTGAITFNGADATLGYRANITVANPVALQSHGKFEVLEGVTGTHAGVISDTGGSFGISKVGPGTLILNGANTYSGGTTLLSASALVVGHDSALGTGPLYVNTPDARLEAWTPVSVANPIVLQHSLTIAIPGDSGGSLTLSGNISEAVDAEPAQIVIRDSDSGGVTLSGVNTHTGGTVVERGRLIISSDASLGAPTAELQFLYGSTLVVTDNITSVRPMTFGGPFENEAYAILDVAEGKTFSSSATLNGVVSGFFSSFELAKTGAGTFIANGVSSTAAESGLWVQEGTFVTTGALGVPVSIATGATLQLGDGGAMPAFSDVFAEEGSRIVFDHNEEEVVIEQSLPSEATLVFAGTGSTTLPNGGDFAGLEARSGTLVIGNDASTDSLLVEPSATLVISNDDLDVGVGVVNGQLVLGGPLTSDPQKARFSESLTLGSTAAVAMELNGHDTFEFSRIILEGEALTFGGTLSIVFGDDYIPQEGDAFQLFYGFDSSTGTFSQIVFSDSAFTGTFDYATGVLTLVAVPEPSTYAFCIVGFLLLTFARRHWKRVRSVR